MFYFINPDIQIDQREQLFAAGHCFRVTRKVEVKDPDFVKLFNYLNKKDPPEEFEIDLECIDPRVNNNWNRESSGSICKQPYSKKILHLFIFIYIFNNISV